MNTKFDLKKPTYLAHIAVSVFFLGFIVQFTEMIWIFSALYLASMAIGIFALVKSKKAESPDKLSLIGYIEAWLAILPSILIVTFTLITLYLLSK